MPRKKLSAEIHTVKRRKVRGVDQDVPTEFGTIVDERIRVLQAIYERGGSVSDAPWARRGFSVAMAGAYQTSEEADDDDL